MTDSTTYAFLHGGGQGSWVWAETIAALETQAAGNPVGVIRLDVPGCGTKRGRTDPTLDNRAIAGELIADLEQAAAHDIVLVGHSQAGQVLPLMAELRPGLFRRLIYVTCSIPLPGQTCLQMAGNNRHGTDDDEVGFPFDPQTMAITDGFPLMFCNDMPPRQEAAFLARLGADIWPAASYSFTDWPRQRPANVSASYVVCLRDALSPVAWQETFADRLGADRRIYVDAGHQVMVTRPQALAELLLEQGVAEDRR